MEELFQQRSCGKLDKGSQNHTAQKQKENISRKFRQKDGKGHRSGSVNGAQGAVYHPTVDKFLSVGSCQAYLPAPAQKGINEKEPANLIERKYHDSHTPLLRYCHGITNFYPLIGNETLNYSKET